MQGTQLWQLCGERKYESCPQWGYDSCAHSVQQPSFQNMGLITNDRDRKEDNGCYQHSTLCLLSSNWATHKTGINSQGHPADVARGGILQLAAMACVWQIKCYLGHSEFLLTPIGVLAPGSAHARPSAWPTYNISRNIATRMYSNLPLNIAPNPQKSYPKFWISRTTLLQDTPLFRCLVNPSWITSFSFRL